MSYSFSLFLKDYASSALMKISNNISNFDSKLRRSQANLQNKFDKSTKSINELNKRLSILNRQRAASTSINDIRRLKSEIILNPLFNKNYSRKARIYIHLNNDILPYYKIKFQKKI